MSNYLYKSQSGYRITKHSYSGSQMWSCPRRYKFRKLDGWRPREDGPQLEFGNCVEAALQYYHQHGKVTDAGVEEFKMLWWKQKDNADLSFTEKSGDWDDHLRMGSEILKLYEAALPSLPIENEQFQLTFDTEFSNGLGYTARVDILSEVEWNHPKLPFIPGSGRRKLIIDIKTSSKEYFEDPRYSALDPQLRDYAWSTGIPTVAFLVLVKNASSIRTGDWVRPLVGPNANKNYQVFDINEERAILVTGKDYDEYSSRLKQIKGKGSTEAKTLLESEYAYRGQRFLPTEITKQKIQFLPAVVSQQDQDEARQMAMIEAAEISECAEQNFFPKKSGVRFPHNQCLNCECLGLCLGDEKLVAEKLIQIDGVF